MDAATTAVTLFELFGKWPRANRLFLGTATGEAGVGTSMKVGNWPPPPADKKKKKRERNTEERENEKKQKK